MRWLVGVLGGCAAFLAFLVGAVSLTRFAGDYLGFPPGLEWTFTGAVDIAGIAGGVMWTAFTGSVRKIGRPMNIVCTLVSGVSVGLDHATHAGRALRDPDANIALPGTEPWWPFVAFVAGVFIPALATWILHALAVIADSRPARQTATAGDRQPHRQAPPAGDRQDTHVVIASSPPADRQRTTTPPAGGVTRTASATASPTTRTASSTTASTARPPALTTASRDRQPARQVSAASTSTPATSARVGFPGPRPDWMSDALLSAVIGAMRQAQRAGEDYGRPRIRKEHQHRMADGKMTDHQARTVQAFVEKHGLLRVPA